MCLSSVKVLTLCNCGFFPVIYTHCVRSALEDSKLSPQSAGSRVTLDLRDFKWQPKVDLLSHHFETDTLSMFR